MGSDMKTLLEICWSSAAFIFKLISFTVGSDKPCHTTVVAPLPPHIIHEMFFSIER